MTATIRIEHPMGAARYVRRERYAWPGGYALALVLADGGALCPDCVASEFPQISYSHRHRLRDDWRPVGVASEADADEGCTCDHCGRTVWPGAMEMAV